LLRLLLWELLSLLLWELLSLLLGPLVWLALSLLLTKTRWGRQVRAAAAGRLCP
jgi:branched-subunit amino acid ABC-type transport system permease component